MLDFLQWGTGSSGSSRESVAVTAGLWVANTFVTVPPPYQYGGDGTQNGVANWSTLSTNDFDLNNEFRLYPNPAKDLLNLEFQSSISNGSVEIYDLLGKQVIAQSVTSNNSNNIDVSSLDSGLYLVSIISDKGKDTRRFIKK